MFPHCKDALRRTVALALLVLTWASVEGGAGADPAVTSARTSSLEWTRAAGAESCIDAGALARAVELRLGRTVFVPAAKAEVSLHGKIERLDPGGWRATVALSDKNGSPLGERELTSNEASCDTLGEQLTLVIAVMIDPEAALAEPRAPKPPEVPRPPPARTTGRPAARMIAPARPPRELWRARTDVGAALGFGALPHATPGITTLFAVKPPRSWELELTFTAWPQATANATATTGSTVSLLEGGAAVCPLALPFARGSDLVGCAGLRAGGWKAQGFGFEVNTPSTEPFVAPEALGRVRLEIAGPLFAGVGLVVGVPLIRQRLLYGGPDGRSHELFRVWPAVVSAELALGLAFP